jgi:hypothetical protein
VGRDGLGHGEAINGSDRRKKGVTSTGVIRRWTKSI